MGNGLLQAFWNSAAPRFRGIPRNSCLITESTSNRGDPRKSSENQMSSLTFYGILYKDVILFCFSESNFPKCFDKYLAHICHA